MQIVSMLAVTALALVPTVSSSAVPENAPTVTLANGPYYGVSQPTYHQDLFLGIPYAQPPVGDLRLRNPQPIHATWTEPKNATEYSPMCYGYGSDTWVLGNYVSEDCLTLNVVRPSGVANDKHKLPVAVWIHGGGYAEGSNRDPRYNLSFIVDQGVQMHKPFIAVNLNYRLHGFGFLWGSAVKAAGVANLGLKDQRLALHWVHDNIEAFGGDPTQVTIFGESAGAGSVGSQLLAYGGRDDKLFRGAIMESLDVATPTSQYVNATAFDAVFHNITNAANCSKADDALDCLRHVPVQRLSDIFNSSVAQTGRFFPTVDGDFLQEPGVAQLNKGHFVHVPLLHGQNEAEGSTFSRFGVNTEAEFLDYVKSTGRTDEQAKRISTLYPDDPDFGVPCTLHERPAPGSFLGTMFKRTAAYGGDMVMHAGRRYMSQIWAKNRLPAFAYNFNVIPNGIPDFLGAIHFQEVAFVFDNTNGDGYNTVAVNPFANKPESYKQLAKMMSRMWISFFVDQTPNHHNVTGAEWPAYTTEDAKILVFDTNATELAYAAPDTYRADGIAYIHSLYD